MLPNASWQEYLLWIFRKRRLFKVVEKSMRPTLNPGDKVLAAALNNPPQAGEIVIAYHPTKPGLRLVKRVQSVFCDGGCYLASDNAADVTAQDSRSFGIVGPDLMIGRVTSVFHRAL